MRLSHRAGCPCHGCSTLRNPVAVANQVRAGMRMLQKHNATPAPSPAGRLGADRGRCYATPVDQALQKEYAFELAASNIRYGEGVTQEVGLDFQVRVDAHGWLAG